MSQLLDLGASPIACFVVTDIETDGPTPGETFAATLDPLPDAEPHPRTLDWFLQNPEAWKNATANPEEPGAVMQRYVAWLRHLPWPRIFAAHPLTFDGIWMDWYLRKFAGQPLFPSLFDEDPPFFGDGLDLPTFIAGRLGVDYSACVRKAYPEDWFGGVRHSHKALDDASGYASVLRHVLAYPTS